MISLNSSAAAPAVGANETQVLQGRLLYHRVGCVACHAPIESADALRQMPSAPELAPSPPSAAFDRKRLEESSVPLDNLATKTTVPELGRFLLDPLKTRPSGRMPSLNLTEPEATALAMYLLREQSTQTNASRPLNRTRGLHFQYFEGDFSDTTKLDNAQPKSSGTVERFSILPRQRDDSIGFRFSGALTVPADGTYTLYTASDDGSRLYLDEQLVVDNDGTHATVEKKATLQLKAGDHPIRVTYFNGGGEVALRVSWQGPGLRKQEIPSAALSHLGLPMVPLEEENLVVNPEKAARGKELFGSLGCAACHDLGTVAVASTLSAKSLAQLDLDAPDNCLAASPIRAPAFRLSDAQRKSLRDALRDRSALSQPLPPKEQVARTLAAFNCLACHSRDGLGGPPPNRAEYFTVLGEADLGDEGRLPPHLTRVGHKLRPDWLREVLLKKGTARPYMATRMPQFGEANLGALPASLEKADAPESAAATADLRPGEPNYGRKLVGTGGLSCISCHVFAGHKSLGVPAMDLSLMTRRLRPDWFHRYLLDPPSLRPGTRMPTFWPEGKSTRPDILSGDTGRQIDAIWAYLSRGREAGLPPGLVQGKMELVASNEALIYRNFIQGAGPRAIGVAYPEKANIAFDANELRLALAWQGPFIDAARHRTGRGEGFEGPLGYNVAHLPPGAPFAVLAEPDAKWPVGSPRQAGYRMHGYQLDRARRPTFDFSFGEVRVEDYPIAVSGALDASLHRTLTLHANQPVENLWFRAWLGDKVEPQPDGSFLVDASLRLKFGLAGPGQPRRRQSAGKWELLVPVAFQAGKAQIVEDILW